MNWRISNNYVIDTFSSGSSHFIRPTEAHVKVTLCQHIETLYDGGYYIRGYTFIIDVGT